MQRFTTTQVPEGVSFKDTGARRDWKESPAYPVYKEVQLLAVGEGVVVTNDEWPMKTRPSQSSLPTALRTMERKYQVKTLADDSGFAVIRTA